jgi:hypothetical protein
MPKVIECDGTLVASERAMSLDHSTINPNHNPSDSTQEAANGSGRLKTRGFVGRARAAAGTLPSQVDEQIKRNPYFTIGIAAAVGAGIGIVFSSRVLRAVLTAAATAAAVEGVRAYLRKNGWVKVAE